VPCPRRSDDVGMLVDLMPAQTRAKLRAST
jgi:hypothetical protein